MAEGPLLRCSYRRGNFSSLKPAHIDNKLFELRMIITNIFPTLQSVSIHDGWHYLLTFMVNGNTHREFHLRFASKKLGDDRVRSRRVEGFETHIHGQGLGIRVARRRKVEDHVV